MIGKNSDINHTLSVSEIERIARLKDTQLNQYTLE
ncbi:hypothetical protein WCLE_002500 [Wolbachia endosymbiont of Cimex lectularius]|nr:hypothetical protein WCLE_002500 [Wolbachia endosymbiont of Cimex lectularius]